MVCILASGASGPQSWDTKHCHGNHRMTRCFDTTSTRRSRTNALVHLVILTVQLLLLLGPKQKDSSTVQAFQVSVTFSSSKENGAHVIRSVMSDLGSRTTSLGPSRRRRRTRLLPSSLLFSSIGGGNDGRPPRDDDDDDEEGLEGFDRFLDPKYQESENLQKAREFMSENSLPISFPDDTEEEGGISEEEAEELSALVFSNSPGNFPLSTAGGGDMMSPEALERNPYMAVVSRLSPSELITKFTATAHPRVQNAVRSTILGLIGGLPKMAFETTTFTTGQRLASLMFQLQMTGYMFKNADYRLSLQQSLGGETSTGTNGQYLLSGGEDEDDDQKVDPLKGKIKGKLRIKYGKNVTEEKVSEAKENSKDDADGAVEVDAAAYMYELRNEVSKLRDELSITRKEKEEALRKDLLAYIRSLPPKELQSLTETMSQDVLVAMKGLVNAVMTGIGEGQIGPNTVTEQSGEAMAQLCMWQLAIGYNLRTLEVREEMKKSLKAGKKGGDEPSESLLDDGNAFA